MLLTNYSELHNQTCTITTLSHQFYHTIYHTLVLLPHTSVITTLKYYLTILFYHTIYHILVLLQHYQTNFHTIYHTLVLLPHYQTIYHAISHTCTITNLSD